MSESYIGMQSFKEENQRKTILLLILYPVLLFVILWLVIVLFFMDNVGVGSILNKSLEKTGYWFVFLLLIIVIVGFILFKKQGEVMFGLSGAHAVTRKENPKIYNIVENLCISRGLIMPKIAIMDEPGMNAFATGWNEDNSWISFTSGLLQNLNQSEIEAVAGHELTHLMNRDSLLMYTAFVVIGCISLLGEVCMDVARWSDSSSNSRSRSNTVNGFFLFGLLCGLLGLLVYPLVKLAISRKREFIADLGSVELTHDSGSMISALQKIAGNSYVSKTNDNIADFFIVNPKVEISDMISEDYSLGNYATSNNVKEKTSIRDSHPSISERIEAIKNYGR